MSALPQRKRPAHLSPAESGNRPIIIFLTVCTNGRLPLLASDEAHSAILAAWSRASHWLVGRYVLLPDHLHLFCAPGIWPPHPLKLWAGYWQNLVTRSWPRPKEKPIWQKDHWDRQLRSSDSYDEKWLYVCGNPVRHGLVKKISEWPYQGEINLLPWHNR